MTKVSESARKDNPDESNNRLKLAEIISQTSETNLATIRELYPEYFEAYPRAGSLEHTSELNSSYVRWIEDYGIFKEMITEFPTIDLYNNYMRYCHENRMLGMDRKAFFALLEDDYNLTENNQ